MSGDADPQSTASRPDDQTGPETLTTAHGAGTAEMRDLLTETVVPRLALAGGTDGLGLTALDDGAVLPTDGDSLVVTTDSHVVDPPEFPGGDIGTLAVAGTVNDLAAMGVTEPLALTCGLVVEAGTPEPLIERVLDSMGRLAETVGTRIVTGDTKVVPAGDVDGVVVNTAGVGFVPPGAHLPTAGLSPGDRLLVTGPVGDHGVALLAEREGFEFATDIESDVAPVDDLVAAAREAGQVTAATDPTRGGLATALIELATASEVGIDLDGRAVPVADPTESAADVLGLDPLRVACEGRLVLGVAPEDAAAVRDAVRARSAGDEAALIGRAVDDHTGRVVVDTGIGERYLTEASGEQLPRIC
ncbi:hydrogenase expression/formation protein HypE [Haloarcula halophila]|uniref:hydrogenase expression/formation protein HypE n=1 Tax=Haloarcula TaxID=2237 RepID=UPI0023E441E3|nr:hydrogenase expression/formation protein HypE [Halomicroarcula sp. DFY41]